MDTNSHSPSTKRCEGEFIIATRGVRFIHSENAYRELKFIASRMIAPLGHELIIIIIIIKRSETSVRMAVDAWPCAWP